jgi:hypothetical protein
MARRPATKKKKPQGETVADVLENLAHDTSTNNPPPDAMFVLKLDDLELEAKNWCDGEPLSNQDQADEVTRLVASASDLEKEIEGTRKAEKEPHLEAGRAVDALYNPLKERADKIAKLAKRALTPWLEAVKAENQRKEREAREEAERAARELQEAHKRARQSSDFVDEDKLAEAEEAAKEAERMAKQAARAKATSTGGGYVAKLRKFWMVNIVDRRELLAHYFNNREDFREELKALLQKFAENDVRQGGVRVLPGCSIWDEERAV